MGGASSSAKQGGTGATGLSGVIGRLTAGAALVAALAVALSSFRDESAVRHARALAEAPISLTPGASAATFPRSTPARAALFGAMAEARQASVLLNPVARRHRLDAARGALGFARRGRPGWGEVALVDAYIGLIADGDDSTSVLAAYRRSYTAAPFLRDAAPWRISYGAEQWQMLDGATREAMIAEATWLAMLAPGEYRLVVKTLKGTPGLRAFQASWKALRAELGSDGA